MGYISTFEYNHSTNFKMKNLKELNEKTKELSSGMSKATVEEYTSKYGTSYMIEMNDIVGKFYDDKDYAKLISKYIETGFINLLYDGEDGTKLGYRVYPHRVKELKIELTETEDIAV